MKVIFVIFGWHFFRMISIQSTQSLSLHRFDAGPLVCLFDGCGTDILSCCPFDHIDGFGTGCLYHGLSIGLVQVLLG